MKRISGYTLVELLLSIVIFSAVLGTLFSVLANLRKSETFRDRTNALTQSASLAFEPMVRAIKQGDAVEWHNLNGQCVGIRGFYGTDDGMQPRIVTATLDGVQRPSGKPVETSGIVTIDAEKVFDTDGLGSTLQWVKRVYTREVPSEGGSAKVVERTYHVTDPNFIWPNPLGSATSCSSRVGWTQVGDDKLMTQADTDASKLQFAVSAPLISTSNVYRGSPFVTVSLTVASPTGAVKPPFSLTSTITPTFSYGEQRE
jgi:type II secretory pathway pseudopilin PulG